MTEHIDLPHLPECLLGLPLETIHEIHSHTYHAIKADRQCRGEPVDPTGDNFGSAEHWKEKAQYWAAEAHKLRQQALRGEPVDGIVPPAAPDNFERAQSIVSKWPGWKRNYVLVKPAAPKFGEEE